MAAHQKRVIIFTLPAAVAQAVTLATAVTAEGFSKAHLKRALAAAEAAGAVCIEMRQLGLLAAAAVLAFLDKALTAQPVRMFAHRLVLQAQGAVAAQAVRTGIMALACPAQRRLAVAVHMVAALRGQTAPTGPTKPFLVVAVQYELFGRAIRARSPLQTRVISNA